MAPPHPASGHAERNPLFFNGQLGASNRIVVWDTTIAQETRDGLLTIFGHELGHYVLGHVGKGLAFSAAMAFVLLYLGYRTIGWLLACRGPAWGIRGLDDWASLPALLLLLSSFGFLATVLDNTSVATRRIRQTCSA
jgi:STE24 endopeptidase